MRKIMFAIEIEGELIVDSTDIAYELERQFPEPPVIPTELTTAPYATRSRTGRTSPFISSAFITAGSSARDAEPSRRRSGNPRWDRSHTVRIFGVSLRQLKGQGTLRKSPGHVLRDLHRHLDAIEDLLKPDLIC